MPSRNCCSDHSAVGWAVTLLINFTWWINRKDRSGNNVFEGGFLGLDIYARHTDQLFQERLADYYFYCDATPPVRFAENETNNERLFGGQNASPYVKDGVSVLSRCSKPAVRNRRGFKTLPVFGPYGGELFIAMEPLERESLAQRLERGFLHVPEAVRITLAMLSAPIR
jgi:hypothetical protein